MSDHLPATVLPLLQVAAMYPLLYSATDQTLDWVTSLFRRVIALYENLPEEGG